MRAFDSTLALRADPYRFVRRRCRAKGSDAFPTRLLLRRALCMTGPAAARFFYDQSLFTRTGAAPEFLRATLFGEGGLHGLDGAAHAHRKAMFLRLLGPGRTDALADGAAAKRLREADVGALPVGKDDRLVGMISDRDIAVRGVAGDKDSDKSIVDELMSETVYYCFEDEDASRAAEVMVKHQVRRLPVLDRDKRLVGLVALADLVKAGVADKAPRGVSEDAAGARQ